jgi:hypothetical protein
MVGPLTRSANVYTGGQDAMSKSCDEEPVVGLNGSGSHVTGRHKTLLRFGIKILRSTGMARPGISPDKSNDFINDFITAS